MHSSAIVSSGISAQHNNNNNLEVKANFSFIAEHLDKPKKIQ